MGTQKPGPSSYKYSFQNNCDFGLLYEDITNLDWAIKYDRKNCELPKNRM